MIKNMSESNDPLKKLILKDDLNREVLASILEKFVKIDLSNGQIILLPDYSKLKNKEQVLIVLLAFKTLKVWEVRKNEETSPKEIEQATQLVGSTIRGILRDLVNEKLVICDKGKYKIPNFLLYQLKDKFENLDLGGRIKRESKKGGVSKLKRIQKDFSRIKSILEVDPKIFNDYHDFLVDTRGKYLEKALLILKIAKDKFSIDGLTPAEIAEILRNKIRVPHIHQTNISLYLGSTKNSRYVFRDPFKGGYIYKLTEPGESFISNFNFQQKEK